jgi:protein-tyrosine-phosphatase
MSRVLFVCTGNIFRSLTAEYRIIELTLRLAARLRLRTTGSGS